MNGRTYTITFLTLTLTAVLFSGCTTPAASSTNQSSNTDAPTGAAAREAEWHLSAQRSLGFYVRVQVPFASNTQRNPEYCPQLFVTIPPGGVRLDLNFTSVPLNTSKPRFGIQGFGAHSGSTDTWLEYPGIMDDQRMWLDNPKRLSFDNPEPGKWAIHTFTYGADYQQLGNLTIDLHGRSAAVPESLDIQMMFNSRTEC